MGRLEWAKPFRDEAALHAAESSPFSMRPPVTLRAPCLSLSSSVSGAWHLPLVLVQHRFWEARRRPAAGRAEEPGLSHASPPVGARLRALQRLWFPISKVVVGQVMHVLVRKQAEPLPAYWGN